MAVITKKEEKAEAVIMKITNLEDIEDPDPFQGDLSRVDISLYPATLSH